MSRKNSETIIEKEVDQKDQQQQLEKFTQKHKEDKQTTQGKIVQSENKACEVKQQKESKQIIDRQVNSQQSLKKQDHIQKTQTSAFESQILPAQQKIADVLMSIDSNYDKSSSGHKELFDFDNNMASGNNIQCIDISILDELNKITSENVDTSVKEIPLPLFVPTKSEELVIQAQKQDNKKGIFEQSTKVEQLSLSQNSPRKQLGMTTKNINLHINPKPQPLDLKTLSGLAISTIDKNTSIKPSSPKGDKKLKPWEKLKKKSIQEQNKEVTKDNLIQQNQGEVNKNPLIQNVQINLNEESLSSKSQEVKITIEQKDNTSSSFNNQVSFNIEKSSINQTDDKQKYTKGLSSLNFQQLPVQPPSPKIQVLKEQTPKKQTQISIRSDIQQQQQSKQQKINAHPFLRADIYQPENNKQILRQAQKKQNNIQISDNVDLAKIKVQDKKQMQKIKTQENIQNNIQKEEKQEAGPLNLSMLQNKKIEQGERSIQNIRELKKKLQELQFQIKMQRNISQQLQIQTPLGIKLVLSMAMGTVVGGASYLFKKKRLSSAVLGVASAVSTFLLTK